MIQTMSRVIHPGWLTVMLAGDSTDECFIYHRCVDCGFVAPPPQLDKDVMLEHAAQEHKSGIFALELYRFRAALHNRHAYWGLRALEWPDTNGRQP